MLIGLHGKKLSGKDTVGNYLVNKYGFERIAFADPLKQAVANLFDLELERVDTFKTDGEIPLAEVILQVGTTEMSYSWREFLQRFGTEMGRMTFGENFWIERWMDAYEATDNDVVVTDVRFDNEARQIIVEGGFVIEVTRPDLELDDHVSERGIDHELIDGWIDNNSTIEDLYRDVDQLVEDIENGRIDNLRLSGRN